VIAQENHITSFQKNDTATQKKHSYWEPWVRQYQMMKPKVSKHAYCQQHQLHYTQFLYWYHKLLSPSQTHEMIPVTVTSTPATPPHVAESLATIQVGKDSTLVLHTTEALALALRELL